MTYAYFVVFVQSNSVFHALHVRSSTTRTVLYRKTSLFRYKLTNLDVFNYCKEKNCVGTRGCDEVEKKLLNNAQYTLFCTLPPLVINTAFKVDFTEDIEKEKGGTVILF